MVKLLIVFREVFRAFVGTKKASATCRSREAEEWGEAKTDGWQEMGMREETRNERMEKERRFRGQGG